MRIGVGGRVVPVRLGVSNKGYGGRIGPITGGAPWGEMGGRLGLLVGVFAAVLALAAIGAVAAGAFWVVAWPYRGVHGLGAQHGAGGVWLVLIGVAAEVVYVWAVLALLARGARVATRPPTGTQAVTAGPTEPTGGATTPRSGDAPHRAAALPRHSAQTLGADGDTESATVASPRDSAYVSPRLREQLSVLEQVVAPRLLPSERLDALVPVIAPHAKFLLVTDRRLLYGDARNVAAGRTPFARTVDRRGLGVVTVTSSGSVSAPDRSGRTVKLGLVPAEDAPALAAALLPGFVPIL